MPYITKTYRRKYNPAPKPFEGIVRKSGRFNYGTQAWKRLRNAKIKSMPLCEICNATGRIKAAQVVDHISPIDDGGDPWAWDNLQSLCTACHNRKTGKEARYKNINL